MNTTPLRLALVAAANAIADAVEKRPYEGPGVQDGRPERVLDYREVAQRLSCHVQTARARGRAGAWAEVRQGGSVGVREADLDKYIKARSVAGERRRPLVVRGSAA